MVLSDEMEKIRLLKPWHREEVLHMCMTEFDEDKFINTILTEGREKGRR